MFKNYEDLNQIMTSLFFPSINPRSIKKFHEMNLKRKIQWRFPNCVHFSTWSTQEVNMATSLRHLLFRCPSLSIISTLSHKGRWFPFSFHIWSAIPDFFISPCTLIFLLSYFQKIAYLTFVYFATATWDRIYEILGCVVLCWGFDSEEMFTKS